MRLRRAIVTHCCPAEKNSNGLCSQDGIRDIIANACKRCIRVVPDMAGRAILGVCRLFRFGAQIPPGSSASGLIPSHHGRETRALFCPESLAEDILLAISTARHFSQC